MGIIKKKEELEQELSFVQRITADERVDVSAKQKQFWDGYEQALRFALGLPPEDEEKLPY